MPFTSTGQEICNNGIDDDNDDLIDLNDDDCACEVIEPKSLIPNPSFEEMKCCPSDRSQLDCATDWIQASEPTTDFIHQCGWLGWDQFPPPIPFPDGRGIMGFRDGRVRGGNNAETNWKEYAGACLINPLIADSSYRFQFDLGFVDHVKSPPIDITFFGTADCAYLPFGKGNEAFGCPTNSPNWIKLGDVRVDGGDGNIWVNTFIDIEPEMDIHAIAIGPECNATNSNVSLYYFFDNLILTNLEFFDLKISEISHPCRQDFTLSVPYNSDFKYQWYLAGIALEGELSSKLRKNYGEGSYQVRIIDGGECRLSTTYEYKIPVYDKPTRITICQGDTYQFGDLSLNESGMYIDTFLTSNSCDSIVELELKVLGLSYDTIEVSILAGEKFEIANTSFVELGDYPLILTSPQGCDSLVLLKLSSFNVYIPNTFSPNSSGQNKTFAPFASDSKIKSVDMEVFDRWGNIVFRGEEWDGYNFQPNVYAYRINLEFEFGTSKLFYGLVTLLK